MARSRKAKRAPWPGAPTTYMRPPWASTHWRLTANPSPVPPLRRGRNAHRRGADPGGRCPGRRRSRRSRSHARLPGRRSRPAVRRVAQHVAHQVVERLAQPLHVSPARGAGPLDPSQGDGQQVTDVEPAGLVYLAATSRQPAVFSTAAQHPLPASGSRWAASLVSDAAPAARTQRSVPTCGHRCAGRPSDRPEHPPRTRSSG